MEDIVAIRVRVKDNTDHFFLTWGRLPESVNERPLLDAVRNNLRKFSLPSEPIAVSLCDSLQEASHAPYFYESLFVLSQKRIPYGKRYAAWAANTWQLIREGNELYYLGDPNKQRRLSST